MRILILNYEFPPLGGGAGNATRYLLREFAKEKKIDFDLITSSIDKFTVEKFSSNITIHRLDIGKNNRNLHCQKNIELIRYSVKAFFYAKKLIKKNYYQLIHAFFGIPCGYLAMKSGLPYIVSLRGSDVPFYNQRFSLVDRLLFRRLSRRVWHRARTVIANSDDLKKLAERTFDGTISVIENGVDTKEFQSRTGRKRSKKIRLLSTGRLTVRKGYQYIIPALKGLPEFELTLVGAGDFEAELRALAIENQVTVNFVGNVEHRQIVKYLQEADIFILPSQNEGMSNSLLEAIACGLPIITTDTGGAKELVKNNGMIIRKMSVSSIESALKRYLDNQKLITDQGRESRKIAEEIGWPTVAKKYIDIYHHNNENQK